MADKFVLVGRIGANGIIIPEPWNLGDTLKDQDGNLITVGGLSNIVRNGAWSTAGGSPFFTHVWSVGAKALLIFTNVGAPTQPAHSNGNYLLSCVSGNILGSHIVDDIASSRSYSIGLNKAVAPGDILAQVQGSLGSLVSIWTFNLGGRTISFSCGSQGGAVTIFEIG